LTNCHRLRRGRSEPGPEPAHGSRFDRFQFGLSFPHGWGLDAELHARSAKDAGKLKQSVQFLELTMKSQPGADSAKLDLHEDHGTIKLS
jgi:hypothetical protein